MAAGEQVGEDRVSTVFLLREDGSALLQLRDVKPGLRHSGMWVPPGGHREANEDDEACARREFHEETGYQCATLHLLTSFRDESDCDPYELTVYWTDYDGQQELHCGEGQKIEFVTQGNADPMPEYLTDIWDRVLQVRAATRAGGDGRR